MKKIKRKFNIEIREDCKICHGPLPTKRHRTYCSPKCRNKAARERQLAKYGREYLAKRQRDYLYLKRDDDLKEKIQCHICGRWFRQVGTHIVQVHGMTAREYREMYGFDVKRGQLPKDLREVKAEHVFDNGTVENLRAGKKYWFKKGQPGVGVYNRSEQTMERLKNRSYE